MYITASISELGNLIQPASTTTSRRLVTQQNAIRYLFHQSSVVTRHYGAAYIYGTQSVKYFDTRSYHVSEKYLTESRQVNDGIIA